MSERERNGFYSQATGTQRFDTVEECRDAVSKRVRRGYEGMRNIYSDAPNLAERIRCLGCGVAPVYPDTIARWSTQVGGMRCPTCVRTANNDTRGVAA